jgi:hypothetical protein
LFLNFFIFNFGKAILLAYLLPAGIKSDVSEIALQGNGVSTFKIQFLSSERQERSHRELKAAAICATYICVCTRSGLSLITFQALHQLNIYFLNGLHSFAQRFSKTVAFLELEITAG